MAVFDHHLPLYDRAFLEMRRLSLALLDHRFCFFFFLLRDRLTLGWGIFSLLLTGFTWLGVLLSLFNLRGSFRVVDFKLNLLFGLIGRFGLGCGLFQNFVFSRAGLSLH